MGLLENLPLNNVTLFVALLLPYALAIYKRRLWYDPLLLRRIEFSAKVLATVLAAIVILKLVQLSSAGEELQLRLVAILHLLALGVILLIGQRGHEPLSTLPLSSDSGAERVQDPSPMKPQENLSWNDLVVDEKVKRELLSVVTLLKSPDDASRYGIETPKGILFQGPPGTGKTTIARVVASAANLPFFVLRLDQITSQWFGESEKNLTRFFETAKKKAPAVIFIDEVDSIGKARGSGAHSASDNLLNHLLQLIDGVIKVKGLYIIAATNRAELVDDALKRSGRLSKTIEIPLPDDTGREKMFALHLAKMPVERGVDITRLTNESSGMSGADIKEICNQAGLNAFTRESSAGRRDYKVTANDLERALQEFRMLRSKPAARQ